MRTLVLVDLSGRGRIGRRMASIPWRASVFIHLARRPGLWRRFGSARSTSNLHRTSKRGPSPIGRPEEAGRGDWNSNGNNDGPQLGQTTSDNNNKQGATFGRQKVAPQEERLSSEPLGLERQSQAPQRHARATSGRPLGSQWTAGS